MLIRNVQSTKIIEQSFLTGEEPVLIECSDRNAYICKYKRSLGSTYKLACEMIGSQFAKAWELNTPDCAFVQIRHEHWIKSKPWNSAPAYGSMKIGGVVDINASTYRQITPSESVFAQLAKIALFDFWIANEDRNANNTNLMYDVRNEKLVSIDYGCIFNTAEFEYPLSQLTSNENIICSDLFEHIYKGQGQCITATINKIEKEYPVFIDECRNIKSDLESLLPKGWEIPNGLITAKIDELFNPSWIENTWRNFTETFTNNV